MAELTQHISSQTTQEAQGWARCSHCHPVGHNRAPLFPPHRQAQCRETNCPSPPPPAADAFPTLLPEQIFKAGPLYLLTERKGFYGCPLSPEAQHHSQMFQAIHNIFLSMSWLLSRSQLFRPTTFISAACGRPSLHPESPPGLHYLPCSCSLSQVLWASAFQNTPPPSTAPQASIPCQLPLL